MKMLISKQVTIQSLLVLSFVLLSHTQVQACERSGVMPGAATCSENSPEITPPEQTGSPPPVLGPGPGPGGGGRDSVSPLWECMANNSDCTVFWVIDPNPDFAQRTAMANCFNFPSQLCRPLGCHQLPTSY